MRVLGLARSALVAVGCAAALGCIDTRREGSVTKTPPVATDRRVTVDFTSELAVVPPFGYGMHTSVYDNALHDPATPAALEEAGIAMLRYPGGGYADNYHFSTHELSAFHSGGEPSFGYLADASDFGSYMSLVEAFDGGVMLTVNYGTNLAGTGPGEPKEAAAWVAYANGDPADQRLIGEDGAGNDWKTVGHWASLRASEPLAADDGQNFLRIAHPAPFAVEYWEIGNEVFGNGYYGQLFEEDLHAPYDESEPYDNRGRAGLPELSGATYGAGVLRYAEAMRAVDSSVKIGAVLGTHFDSFGPSWNAAVLDACAFELDFGIVHFYPAEDPSALLAAPRVQIASAFAELRQRLVETAGERADEIELAVTEVGAGPGLDWRDFEPVARHAQGLFALDAYLTFLEQGASNVAWLELHNGSFLSERSAARGPAFHGISMAHRLAAPGDTLVTATSESGIIVAHAARRADGTLGVLVVNTQAPSAGVLSPIDVPVTLLGDAHPTSGVRYDYAPLGEQPGVLEGPTPVSELGSSFTLTLAPYQATLVVLGAEP